MGSKAITKEADAMPPDAATGDGRSRDSWGAKPSARNWSRSRNAEGSGIGPGTAGVERGEGVEAPTQDPAATCRADGKGRCRGTRGGARCRTMAAHLRGGRGSANNS